METFIHSVISSMTPPDALNVFIPFFSFIYLLICSCSFSVDLFCFATWLPVCNVVALPPGGASSWTATRPSSCWSTGRAWCPCRRPSPRCTSASGTRTATSTRCTPPRRHSAPPCDPASPPPSLGDKRLWQFLVVPLLPHSLTCFRLVGTNWRTERWTCHKTSPSSCRVNGVYRQRCSSTPSAAIKVQIKQNSSKF